MRKIISITINTLTNEPVAKKRKTSNPLSEIIGFGSPDPTEECLLPKKHLLPVSFLLIINEFVGRNEIGPYITNGLIQLLTPELNGLIPIHFNLLVNRLKIPKHYFETFRCNEQAYLLTNQNQLPKLGQVLGIDDSMTSGLTNQQKVKLLLKEELLTKRIPNQENPESQDTYLSQLLEMGFGIEQLIDLDRDDIITFIDHYNSYEIPDDIIHAIDALSEQNPRLDLSNKHLTTGQICKIINTIDKEKLSALRMLHLTNNRLTVIPESFGKLTSLERLYLQDNQLTALPNSFGELIPLRILYLNNNQLTALPEMFDKLIALTDLYLDDNQLISLPGGFGKLIALERLSLANNQLTALPDSFGKLTALLTLFLAHNNLISLPGSIGKLTALQIFTLYNNPLTVETKVFLSALSISVIS